MSNLPNSDNDKIKVYPNEYITNSTINRPNLRLLANDLYLESVIVSSGILGLDIISLSSAVTGNTLDISYLDTRITIAENNILTLDSRIDQLETDNLSGLVLVDQPSSSSASGNELQIALSGGYVYFYNPNGSVNWGRTQLDYSW